MRIPQPRRYFAQIVVLLLLTFPFHKGIATHIVGGEITYECLGPTTGGDFTYRVMLDLYLNCGPDALAGFDNRVNIRIFDGSTRAYVSEVEAFYGAGLEDIVGITSYDTCYPPPTGLCYSHFQYRGTVVLPPNPNGYHVAWQRCCRNNSIVNIFTPGDRGSTYYAYIAPTSYCNNSPTFATAPPTYICLGDTFQFDHSAIDPDGDSLVYEFVTPFIGGSPANPTPLSQPPPYTNVFWSTGHSLGNILNGPVPMTIDSSTGVINAVPGSPGQYVWSIMVTEYRGGVRIGEIRRDFQTNVMSCPRNNPPEIIPPSGDNVNGDTLYFTATEDNCFTIRVEDVNGAGFGTDSVSIIGIGEIFGGGSILAPFASLADSGIAPLDAQICWKPSCDQVGLVSEFYIPARDNWDCPPPHIVFDTLIAKVVPPVPEPPGVRCVSVESENTIEVTWINPPTPKLEGFSSYYIFRNSGSGWELIADVSDSLATTFIDTSVSNAYTQSYCYRLSQNKFCPGLIEGPEGIEGCSMVITASRISQVQSLVEWTPYEVWPLPSYELFADSGNGLYSIDTLLVDTSSIYFECFFEGRFRTVTVDPVTGCEAWSGWSNERVHKDSVPVQNRMCSISIRPDDASAELAWTRAEDGDVVRYRVFRNTFGENNWEQIYLTDSLSELSFVDLGPLDADERRYCYKVEQEDLCNNFVDSQEMCSILLNGESGKYFTDLDWTAYEGWRNGVENYAVWFTNAPDSVLVEEAPGSVVNLRHRDISIQIPEYCYRIMAEEADGGCEASAWSNEVCVQFPPTLFIPNAFTPNLDGKNDFFQVPPFFMDQFHMVIYNRWGELIFESFDVDLSWDGTYRGQPVPEGTYIYRVSGIGFEGTELTNHGSLILYR